MSVYQTRFSVDCHWAVGYSISGKGYVGTGRYWDGGSAINYRDFWEYDPSSNTWTQKADLTGSDRWLAVAFPIGTRGYVGTGISSAPLGDFWEYDPQTDGWTSKATFGGTARYSAVGFSIGNEGYVGTGIDVLGRRRDFWRYRP